VPVSNLTLIYSDSPKVKLDVQGRFEQVLDSPYGEVMASHLMAVAAKDNVSATVEVSYGDYIFRATYDVKI
jgi:hypothetical protein